MCRQRYTDDMYRRALATFELIMLRQGIFAVPEVCVSNEDMRHCIVSVCTSWLDYDCIIIIIIIIIIIFSFLFFTYFSFVYFVYDFMIIIN